MKKFTLILQVPYRLAFLIIYISSHWHGTNTSNNQAHAQPQPQPQPQVLNNDNDNDNITPGMVVAGYLPDYRSYIDIKTTAGWMTDLILFSISPEPVSSSSSSSYSSLSSCCLDESHYSKARDARSTNNPNLNILVSVGGGGRSNHFAKISSTKHGRQALIQDLISLCVEEELNGVDLDWEQPTSQEQFISYLHLIIEASDALQKKGLILSVALHVNQILPKEVYPYIDRIHLMTYDIIYSLGSHHASYDNVAKAVDDFISNGCDPAKIVLGLPAYGRHAQKPGLVKTYSEIIDEVIDEKSPNNMNMNMNMNKNTRNGNSKHLINNKNELFSKNEHNGYLFDSPQMIQAKVGLVREKGLRGVFFWELGQDYRNDEISPGGLLLQSASTTHKLNDEL